MADPQDSPTAEPGQTPPLDTPVAKTKGSGAVWLVLGGLVAAGLGFGGVPAGAGRLADRRYLSASSAGRAACHRQCRAEGPSERSRTTACP